MADDGVIFIDGTRMYKHILFHCENGKRVVQGFLLSSMPESNTERQDIMFIADNDPIQQTVNEGWQLDADGNWTPPETSPAATKTNLECDIAEIECQLHLLREYEETAKWLGVAPYSEECNAVLTPPEYHKPEIPQAPKHKNLFKAFQSLVGNEIQDIKNAGIRPMKAAISKPKPIPSKNELLARHKKIKTRLRELKKTEV